MGHGSPSVSAKQTEQRRVSSFTERSAWASASAYARSARRTWKASRPAVFSPMPGRRMSSCTRRVIEGVMRARSRHAGKLDAETSRHLPHLVCDEPLCTADALVDGGDDEILDHLDVL